MYIVVSSDPRIPLDLVQSGFQVEQWSPEEFIARATDESNGLEIDDGLWYDVADLQAEIYEALDAYSEQVAIMYYRFDDRPMPSFTMTDEVKVYSTVQEPEPVEEPAYEPAEEPIPDTMPTNVVQPEATYTPTQPPIQSTPENVEQPVYTQPQAYPQSQVYQPPVEPTMPVAQNVQMNPNIPEYVKTPTLISNVDNLLQHDDYDTVNPHRTATAAKVVFFGSSKGGSGKTFTCLISARWYALTHPTERVCLADFDIIDGQIGITINKLTPTTQDYYKLYKNGYTDFINLENCKVKSDHFSPNMDFYLAPSQDISTITNDTEFWKNIYEQLIKNYDVVFFDSGIDYLGLVPISNLYKIASKIYITSNPSINSVKSVIKQLKTLSGERQNNVFRLNDDILSRVNLILTRMDNDEAINSIVRNNLTKYAPIVAEFGQIDKEIKQVQWYQDWEVLDSTPAITEQLDKIVASI